MRVGALRSYATVWRPSEVEGQHRSRVTVYAIAGAVWLELGRGTRGLRDYGAGEEPQNGSPARTHALTDVQPRDVLQVTAGPESGTSWKVEGVDRTEPAWLGLALKTFTGSLP